VSLPFFLLGLLEALALFAAVYEAAYLRFLPGAEDVFADVEQYVGPVFPRALLFAAVMMVCMIAMGLYQSRVREGLTGAVLRLFTALLIGTVLLSAAFYVFPSLHFGRGILIGAAVIAFISIVLVRFVFLRVIDTNQLRRRVIVLGAGEKAASITRFLRRKTDRRGFEIVAYLRYPRWRTAPDLESDKVIPLSRPILSYALEFGADEVVVAMDERRQRFPLDELLDCKLNNIEVIELLDFFEREAGKVKLDLLSPSWLIYSDGFKGGRLVEYAQRGFDLLAATLLLCATWPIMLLTALAIRLECAGSKPCPVFYRQERIGVGGKPFHVLKFRSMRTDAEVAGQAQWAQRNDPRVTRIGGFIRKVRIDELPQIFNVLRGDMSFIGPRPERPPFVEDLMLKLPYYAERHRVKPGITGWAQLCYPYGSSDRDAMEKLQYDLYYIKNRTMLLNLIILVQTVEVVLFGRGAR
jgi:sugar transferase (PEP-CTERM system associated)